MNRYGHDARNLLAKTMSISIKTCAGGLNTCVAGAAPGPRDVAVGDAASVFASRRFWPAELCRTLGPLCLQICRRPKEPKAAFAAVAGFACAIVRRWITS